MNSTLHINISYKLVGSPTHRRKTSHQEKELVQSGKYITEGILHFDLQGLSYIHYYTCTQCIPPLSNVIRGVKYVLEVRPVDFSIGSGTFTNTTSEQVGQ